MKPSAKHLLGTGLLVVAALPMLASYGTASLAARPVNQLHAVTAQATPITPQPPSGMPDVSRANFKRADYEAALAKWRAQDAAEYRIEVTLEAFSLLRGPWWLTVGVDDAKEFVTKIERPEGLDPATAAVQELERLTVGGLLTQIEAALRSVENPSPDDTAYDYNVSFHPTLGYPVSFTAKPLDAFVADADYAYSVQSVTILQTGIYTPPADGEVPGMPSTGHPEK